MTLVIAVQDQKDGILLAADGMGFETSTAEKANMPFSAKKLLPVSHTKWLFSFAGSDVRSAYEVLEQEIGSRSLKLRSMPSGGHEYLNRVRKESSKATLLLAGFDAFKKPHVLVFPEGGAGIIAAQPVHASGAQEATARWIVRTLLPTCETLHEKRRLLYFTIWTIANHELTIGEPANYPVAFCVLAPGKNPVFINNEDRMILEAEMPAMMDRFQAAFRSSASPRAQVSPRSPKYDRRRQRPSRA